MTSTSARILAAASRVSEVVVQNNRWGRMFEPWSEFFLLLGSSAGALIGLLFVVATLSAEKQAESNSRGIEVYATPTVFHLGVVLVLSAVVLAPGVLHVFIGLVTAACGGVGLAYMNWVVRQFVGAGPPQGCGRVDVWLYGWVPAAVYVVLVVTAIALALDLSMSPFGLGLATLALLLVAIYNAWDLAGWLAHPAKKTKKPTSRGEG